MKHLKMIAFAAVMASTASIATGFEIVGHPIISDGTNSVSMHASHGEFSVNICNTKYWFADSNSLKHFNNMKARMDSHGGYVFHHTDAPGNKRWYSCAWGRYENLHGTLY